MPVLVYTDFDQTMIQENSPKILGKEMLRFYKKTFGWLFIFGNLPKILYQSVLYQITGKTEHFYRVFFYFDENALQRVVQQLTLNPRWLAALQDIRRREGGDVEITLVIISRNLIGLIRRFVKQPSIKKEFAALSCRVREIIAHADILADGETIITAGVWRSGMKEPMIDARGLASRMISRQELRTVSVLTVMPYREYTAKIMGAIGKNKHLYLQKGEEASVYYIGDAEEKYLIGKGIPKERFYQV